jgi:hypothetical protein
MSKLSSPTKLPEQYRKSDLFRILTDIDTQINNLSDGRVVAVSNNSASPTSSVVGSSVGDEVRNTNATVQGTVGAQYVVRGWICTTSGTPGVWREERVLTGT